MRVLKGQPLTLYVCSYLSQLQQGVHCVMCVMAGIKTAAVKSTLGKQVH